VEGHCRGILRRWLEPLGERVIKDLPFSFPVKPDVVVMDGKDRIKYLGIVAYSTDASSTHKKFYRTRLEYERILLAFRTTPELFAPHFLPFVIIYGASEGWKREILAKLSNMCVPTMFLPASLGESTARAIVINAFEGYQHNWEAGGRNATEFVEDAIASSKIPLTTADEQLLQLMQSTLSSNLVRQSVHSLATAVASANSSIRIPSPFQTRVRQGLSMLSLFSGSEIEKWLSYRNSGTSIALTAADAFIRRGRFLDTLQLFERPSIIGSHLAAIPRRPVKVGTLDYAPDRPDFENWENLGDRKILEILKEHRAMPLHRPAVFHGGALDQVCGNWQSFCRAWSEALPELRSGIAAGDKGKVEDVFERDEVIQAETWQPSHGMAGMLAIWGICVAAVAILERARSTRYKFSVRSEGPATVTTRRALAERLLTHTPSDLLSLLVPLEEFARALLSAGLSDVAKLEQPRLLSLDEPRSWISACYLAIVTNSTHSPLCSPMHKWLVSRFQDVDWKGWPNKRSVAVKELLPKHIGNVQWQFGGVSRGSHTVVVAEVKSITANNWGNKSKELFDRFSETSRAFADAGVTGLIVGVLDGDMDDSALEELSQGGAYHEIFSIEELMRSV
jgi:hypothetical protein